MAEFKKVITNKGQELITAAAFDSGELAVKYIVIGDANGESYEPSPEQTALVNQRNKLLITERIVNSPTRYTFLVQIPQDIDYYIIREIGLVDENDNLIEIAQMEQETYIQSDNLVQQLTIGIQIDVGQSSTVIVLADTNIETASKDFVNNNFQNLNQKGQANGYCGLDELCKIPQANIPDLFTNKDLSNLSALGQAILDKKVEVEALLQPSGYAKFSWKENNVISKIIFIFLNGTFDTISVPANSSITKVLNLPIIIDSTVLNYVAITNSNSVFCTTVRATDSTIEVRLNNVSNSARTVSRLNLIAIVYE